MVYSCEIPKCLYYALYIFTVLVRRYHILKLLIYFLQINAAIEQNKIIYQKKIIFLDKLYFINYNNYGAIDLICLI